MGNCCSGSANEGEVNIQNVATGGFGNIPTKNINDLFDDREVLGLRGRSKIAIIVKIQALFRGVLTRRRIKQRFGFEAKTLASINRADAYYQNGETNYGN